MAHIIAYLIIGVAKMVKWTLVKTRLFIVAIPVVAVLIFLKDWYEANALLADGIWIKGKHVPVTQEIYEAYYRPVWRERKRVAAHGNRDVSYETLMEKAKNKYAETTVSAAEEVFFAKLLTYDLRQAISMLTDDERQIMIGIYVNDKTEREIAVQLGVPNTTIHYRKAVALKKLKKLLTE